MPSLYLDASALVSLYSADRHSRQANAALAAWQDAVLLSDWAVTEFHSALAMQVRMQRVTAEQADDLLTLFGQERPQFALAVASTPDDHIIAQTLLRFWQLGLRAGDALHLAICERLDSTLLTFDQRMRDAARRTSLPLFVPTP